MSGQWEMEVRAPCPWLTANDRLDRWEKAHRIRLWRSAAYLAARRDKLPTDLDHIRIEAVARFAGPPPVRDLANLHPTVKAVVDGLGPRREARRNGTVVVSVGYGLVPDDSDRHVDGPHLSLGEALPARPYSSAGLLLLKISEVARA